MTYVQYPIKSDLDRLSYDEYREKTSLFSETWLPASLGFAAFFTFAANNVAMRKPYYTGIQKLLFYIPVGVFAGIYFRDRQREKSRQKWAAHKHYIEF
ncbi:hypothetical protein FOCC_FOCC005244 [Frankliniella occidentalis]|nr:hypothetical protein FOCC_FOCC005244 [Frankliniella occidentalis]